MALSYPQPQYLKSSECPNKTLLVKTSFKIAARIGFEEGLAKHCKIVAMVIIVMHVIVNSMNVAKG